MKKLGIIGIGNWGKNLVRDVSKISCVKTCSSRGDPGPIVLCITIHSGLNFLYNCSIFESNFAVTGIATCKKKFVYLLTF